MLVLGEVVLEKITKVLAGILILFILFVIFSFHCLLVGVSILKVWLFK